MKKSILIIVLVAAILISVVSGTLALYQVSLDDLTGDVTAKQFKFTLTGGENFSEDFKLAPTEKVVYPFSVANYDGSVQSEVAMDVDISIEVVASTGKKPIGNLKCYITDENDVKIIDVPLNSGEGKASLPTYYFGLDKKDVYFKIVLFWQSSEDDVKYQGSSFGNKVKVSAIATQNVNGEVEEVLPEVEIDPEKQISENVFDNLERLYDKSVFSTMHTFNQISFYYTSDNGFFEDYSKYPPAKKAIVEELVKLLDKIVDKNVGVFTINGTMASVDGKNVLVLQIWGYGEQTQVRYINMLGEMYKH